MKNAVRLRNASLILFVLALNGCAKPPAGPIGVIGDSGCFVNDPTQVNPDYMMSFEDCGKAGMIATTAVYDRILRQAYVDCAKPGPGPMCVLGPAGATCADPSESGRTNVCFEKQVIDGTCDLTWGEAKNFVITTADYFRRLRQWYERRCN